MLYLIKSNNYLKIGYTQDLKKRMKEYKTHNPDFRLIAKREGSKENETELHHLFKDRKHYGEWFEYSEEIVNTFNNYEFVKSYKETAKIDNCYMTFIDYISPIFRLTSTSARNLLVWMCQHAEFNTGKVVISSETRKQICTSLNITNSTISNNISKLKKLKLIAGEGGEYTINPQIFWKGDNKIRKDLLNNKEIKVTFSI